MDETIVSPRTKNQLAGPRMMSPTERTGVIIVHYSSLENVRGCLKSLQKSTSSSDFCPIIVSNGAKESAEPLRQEFGEWIEIITLEKNRGFTGGNNAGLQWAKKNLKSPAVILLNDDTTVAPNTLAVLRDTLLSTPQQGALCPLIYFSKGREFHPGYTSEETGRVIWYGGGCIDWTEVIGFHEHVDEVDRDHVTAHDTDFATGCCVALRWEALDQVGLFTEKAFLYWEDVELSARLKSAGWSVGIDPATHMWHHNAGSSNGSGSALHVYYQTRNRFWFGWKFAPLRTKLFLVKHAVTLLRQGTPEEKRAILDWLQGNYGHNSQLHT